MSDNPLVINGWTLLADVCFIEALERLKTEVHVLRQKNPESWVNKNAAKRLAAIARLMLQDIPSDPSRDIYRLGTTLGKQHKHWLRAKFYQQYRLFFRYQSERKIIIYGWVNGPKTKRSYGSKTDAYLVFNRMLQQGCPPNDWEALLAEALTQRQRFSREIDDLST